MKNISGPGGVIGPLPRTNQEWASHQKSIQKAKSILVSGKFQHTKIVRGNPHVVMEETKKYATLLQWASKQKGQVLSIPCQT